MPSHSVNQTARETHPTNQRLYANEAKEEASVYLDVTCVSRGLTVTDLSTLSVKSKMRGKHYQASQWLYINEAVHIAHTFFLIYYPYHPLLVYSLSPLFLQVLV